MYWSGVKLTTLTSRDCCAMRMKPSSVALGTNAVSTMAERNCCDL